MHAAGVRVSVRHTQALVVPPVNQRVEGPHVWVVDTAKFPVRNSEFLFICGCSHIRASSHGLAMRHESAYPAGDDTHVKVAAGRHIHYGVVKLRTLIRLMMTAAHGQSYSTRVQQPHRL